MLTELENYQSRIDDLRRQVGEIIDGLSAEALNWVPFDGTEAKCAGEAANSLAVLAAHIAGAEHYWMAEVIGCRPSSRQREAEFRTRVEDADILLALLKRTASESREIFSQLKPTDLDGTRQVGGHSVTVRWGLLHVVDHTALHLGHMQLTYQLRHGGRNKPSPLWYQRLPQRSE